MSDTQNTDLSFLKINRDAPRETESGSKSKIILFSAIGLVVVVIISFFAFGSGSSAEKWNSAPSL